MREIAHARPQHGYRRVHSGARAGRWTWSAYDDCNAWPSIEPLRGRAPGTITVDHSTEFTWRALDEWAYRCGGALDFNRPGKPTESGFIEAFNGKLRDESSNAHQFLSIEDARSKIEAWRVDYKLHRPQSSLSQLTPRE